MALDPQGVAAPSGSACPSGSLEPSPVLTAMGLPLELARGSLRLTVGTDNTMEDIEYVLEVLPGIVSRLRWLAAPRPERAGGLVPGAGDVRPGLLRDRDDRHGDPTLRPRPLRRRGDARLAAPGG